MQISDLRIFLSVASTGSLSAAARQLDVGPMQVSRRIAVLEEELGIRLFHRTTRSVSLTAEGEGFVPYANTITAAEENARNELSPSPAKASGVLRVTAPSVFGQTIILPLLTSLLQQHPELSIDLDLSDRNIDIVSQGLDLALRVATLGDSELVARRVTHNPRVIFASPHYLQRCGIPEVLADLEKHQCITLQTVPRWPLMVEKKLQRIHVNSRFVTNNVAAARSAAVQGLGLAMLTYWDVHMQLKQGELIQVELKDASTEDLSVWAVMPTRRYVPTRVKVFLDALEQELARLHSV
ncbi:LysR substrate-binding domain-containing protein [Undibacterium sp.]|uniref:LysR family transcriptional regulator n=1 Tax=Undibacterium sp. TaxID=1914977 RepID=UPI00374C9D1E